MKNLPLLLGTVFGTILLVVVVAALFSKGADPVTVDQTILMNNTRLVKGSNTAKVIVVGFGDMQCPACASQERFVTELLAKYPNDVKFIFRHFPLVGVHANAQMAAQAVEAAATFDLATFWKLHDYLYLNQSDWSELDKNGLKQKLGEYADKLQIDKVELMKRIESQEVKDRIATDVSDANKLGVDGTPTFYVNGQKTLAPQLESTVASFLAK